jgi:hypothetical protein
MKDLTYTLPNSLGTLIITAPALAHMLSKRQRGWFKSEAGGQLFAIFEKDAMRVVEATGPRKKDIRSRFSFYPHRLSERTEIRQKFEEQGLHFVGD